MKHKTLFYFVAVLLTFFIAFNACQEEDIIASKELQPVAKSAKIYSLFLTKNEVLSDFNNPKIAGIINSKFSNSIEARQMTNADSLLFEKIVKDDNFVTYNLLLNQYTEQTPYLEYFTITKDSLNKVRAGYIKYTPTTSEIDFSKYNGIIEVFGLDDVLIGKAAFANGLLQPEPQNSSSRWACLGSYTIIVQHNCTNGGNHAPGTVCNDGINDGYYELVTHLTGCHFLADPHQIIGDLEGSINSLGSGDYNTQNLNLLMTHLNAQEKALINSNIYFRKHILGLVSGITELDDDYILYMKGILDYYLLNYEVYQSLQSYTANPVENENKTIVIDNLLARLTENQTEGQKNFTKEAFDYLTENPEEDEFITWAIDYLMLHPEFDTAQENWLEEIEFEYWSQHINRLDIDSNPCAKIVYDSLFQNSNKTAFKLVKSYM